MIIYIPEQMTTFRSSTKRKESERKIIIHKTKDTLEQDHLTVKFHCIAKTTKIFLFDLEKKVLYTQWLTAFYLPRSDMTLDFVKKKFDILKRFCQIGEDLRFISIVFIVEESCRSFFDALNMFT